MVTPPFVADIDWSQTDTILADLNGKAANPIAFNQVNSSENTQIQTAPTFLHSHTLPQPHTHSHPYDIHKSHSHSFLEYNYNLVNPTSGRIATIDGTSGTIAAPEHIQYAMSNKDENKLIHLDPVPDFKDKNDIKPWLQKIFYPQGIELVIERSDSTKVVFKCKASKRGKNAKEPMLPASHKEKIENNSTGSDTKSAAKKKRSVSRFNVCPFRIRATYSLKRKRWGVVVMNNMHSHDLEFNPNSEEYKKFKDKLKDDGDMEAVKKFDELEYRVRAHLPIHNTMIPCDCGMTSEIQSFNIVMPTTLAAGSAKRDKSSGTSPGQQPLITTNSNIHKPPPKKRNDSLLQRTAKKNLMTMQYTNSPSEIVGQSLSMDSPMAPSEMGSAGILEGETPANQIPNLSDFMDDQFHIYERPNGNGIDFSGASGEAVPGGSGLPMMITTSGGGGGDGGVMDLNEIDFTNIFTKSFNGNNVLVPTSHANSISHQDPLSSSGAMHPDVDPSASMTPDSALLFRQQAPNLDHQTYSGTMGEDCEDGTVGLSRPGSNHPTAATTLTSHLDYMTAHTDSHAAESPSTQRSYTHGAAMESTSASMLDFKQELEAFARATSGNSATTPAETTNQLQDSEDQINSWLSSLNKPRSPNL